MRILAALALLSIAACATTQATPPVQRWQDVVTAEDRVRLRDWRSAFTRALEQARAANHGQEIEREGALLDPDAALGGPIPDGNYRCRVIKVGAKSQGLLDYVTYPAFRCRIEHGCVPDAVHREAADGLTRVAPRIEIPILPIAHEPLG